MQVLKMVEIGIGYFSAFYYNLLFKVFIQKCILGPNVYFVLFYLLQDQNVTNPFQQRNFTDMFSLTLD